MSATSTRGMIGFLEIDRDGCMRMLAAASGRVGRIAFSYARIAGIDPSGQLRLR